MTEYTINKYQNYDVTYGTNDIQEYHPSYTPITEEMAKKYNWTLREPFDPFESKGEYLVKVRLEASSFSSDYELMLLRKDARRKALMFLLEFYNKQYDEDDLEPFYNDFIKSEEWYLAPRPGSKIEVLTRTKIKEFNEVFNISKIPFLDDDYYDTIEIELYNIESIFLKIEKKLHEIRGIISKLQLEKLLRIGNFNISIQIDFLVKLRFELLKLLHLNNFVSFEPNEWLVIYIDQEYNILRFEFRNNIQEKYYLDIGINRFLNSDVGKSIQLISFVYNIYKDQDKLDDGSISWVEFLVDNIFPNPIIDFGGLDPEVANTIVNVGQVADEYVDINLTSGDSCLTYNEPPNYREDLVQYYKNILSNIDKLKLAAERGVALDFASDDIFNLLPNIVTEIDSLVDFQLNVANKIDLGQLLEDLQNCIPGICVNLNIPWPKIPKLPLLPTFDLTAFIRIEIEKIVIKIILQLLKDVLINIVLSLPRYCQDGETINFPWDFGEIDLSDLAKGEDLKDTVQAFPPKNTVSAPVPPQCTNETILQFLQEISESLTVSQLCGLLTGNASSTTIDIIFDILNQDKYECLSVYIQDITDLQNFFQNFGGIIGLERINKICQMAEEKNNFENHSLDCTRDDYIRSLQKQLYQMKTGENRIPEEFIEQQIDQSNKMKNAPFEAVNNLPNMNLAQAFQDNIQQIELFQSSQDSLQYKFVRDLVKPLKQSFQTDIENFVNLVSFQTDPLAIQEQYQTAFGITNDPLIPKSDEDNIISSLYQANIKNIFAYINSTIFNNDFVQDYGLQNLIDELLASVSPATLSGIQNTDIQTNVNIFVENTSKIMSQAREFITKIPLYLFFDKELLPSNYLYDLYFPNKLTSANENLDFFASYSGYDKEKYQTALNQVTNYFSSKLLQMFDVVEVFSSTNIMLKSIEEGINYESFGT